MLLQLAGLLPTGARSPPRAARETRHMSSAPKICNDMFRERERERESFYLAIYALSDNFGEEPGFPYSPHYAEKYRNSS